MEGDTQARGVQEAELQRASLHNAELASLTKSVAWGMLLAFVTDQTTKRMNHIMLTPVTDMTQAHEQNFMRGECAGLNLVKKFMEEQLLVSQETVELYKQALSDKGDE